MIEIDSRSHFCGRGKLAEKRLYIKERGALINQQNRQWETFYGKS